MWGYVAHHYATCADLCTGSYFDIANDRRIRTNQNPGTYLGMSVSRFLTGPSQCHTMENRDVVFHNSGLANHESCGMVEHHATTHMGARVQIYAENARDLILEKQCERVAFVPPEPMCDTVDL